MIAKRLVETALLLVVFTFTILSTAWAAEKLSITVSNYPLAYFSERIAGDLADINFPAKEAADPAFWKPSAAEIIEMQKSDLIVINGASYEKWLAAVSIPRSRMVDTSASFQKRYIHEHQEVTHTHGPGGEHAHHGVAFTTWLNFELAQLQAQAIAESVSKKLPQKSAAIAANLKSLRAELNNLHHEMQKIAITAQNQPLLASHPVYQYLAKGYGLNIQSVHWEPDVLPVASEWITLQKMLKSHAAKTMLWEGQPLAETTEQLKKLGVESVVFSPAGNLETSGDFIAVMRKNIENLSRALT